MKLARSSPGWYMRTCSSSLLKTKKKKVLQDLVHAILIAALIHRSYFFMPPIFLLFLSKTFRGGSFFFLKVLMDTPHVRTAAAAVEPLTALFGGMYLASLGMIMSPAFLLRHLTEIMLYVAAIYVLKVEEEQEDSLIKIVILMSILSLIPFLRCALRVHQLMFIRYEKVTVVTGVMRSFGFAIPAALSAGVILAQVL